MSRLSYASITALVATILLGLAFLVMPLLNAPSIVDEQLATTEEGDIIYEPISALSLALNGDLPELGYSLPVVNLLAIAVVIAIIAMAASFLPAVTRTGRYVLLVAGILVMLGYFAVPLQVIETELTNYAQMLGYGFWVGVLAAIVLIAQGFMGQETDSITDTVSDFVKNFRFTRQQLLSAILIIIGVAAFYRGTIGFREVILVEGLDAVQLEEESAASDMETGEATEEAAVTSDTETGEESQPVETDTETVEEEPAPLHEERISMQAGDMYSVTLEAENSGAFVHILNAAGEEVASGETSLDFTAEANGSYTVVVDVMEETETPIGNYTLRIEALDTVTTTLNFAPHGFRPEDESAEPLQLVVPTGQFIVISSVYFIVVGALGIANLEQLKRVMPFLLVFAGVMIFMVLLVGSAAGGSTNATTMITESLRTATPIAIGAMAGIWCERSGVINIAIEGMMLFGACIGFTTLFLLQAWFPNPDLVYWYMFLGVLAAIISGGLVSLLHAWLSITFATDQIVSGTVINILALGTTSYIRAEVLLSSEAGLNRLPALEIPILSKLPVIGPVFASQPIFYLMFVVIILTHVMLYHTRWGLRTIAVGENPHAADTLGIKVNRIRWINVFIGGMIAGLAGAWFSLEATGRFTDSMTDGKGFISLAAMIFGKWTPAGSFGGSLLFGFSESLGFRFQIENVALPPQFLQMVPYIVTLIVLAGLVGRAIPPKAVGQPYKTEGSR